MYWLCQSVRDDWDDATLEILIQSVQTPFEELEKGSEVKVPGVQAEGSEVPHSQTSYVYLLALEVKAESGRPWGSLVSCTTESVTSVSGAAGKLKWRAIGDTQHQPGLRMLTHTYTQGRETVQGRANMQTTGKQTGRQADDRDRDVETLHAVSYHWGLVNGSSFILTSMALVHHQNPCVSSCGSPLLSHNRGAFLTKSLTLKVFNLATIYNWAAYIQCHIGDPLHNYSSINILIIKTVHIDYRKCLSKKKTQLESHFQHVLTSS